MNNKEQIDKEYNIILTESEIAAIYRMCLEWHDNRKLIDKPRPIYTITLNKIEQLAKEAGVFG